MGSYFFFSCNGLHHISSTRRKNCVDGVWRDIFKVKYTWMLLFKRLCRAGCVAQYLREALLMREEDHLKMSFLPLGRDTLTAKETVLGAGEMDSVVQSISCFSRELGLDSQHQQNSSQLSVTSVPQFPLSSSGTWQAHSMGALSRQKTRTCTGMVKWFWAQILSYKYSCALHVYLVSVTPFSLFLRPFLTTCMQKVPSPERIRSGVSDTNRTQYLAGSIWCEKIRIG